MFRRAGTHFLRVYISTCRSDLPHGLVRPTERASFLATLPKTKHVYYSVEDVTRLAFKNQENHTGEGGRGDRSSVGSPRRVSIGAVGNCLSKQVEYLSSVMLCVLEST